MASELLSPAGRLLGILGGMGPAATADFYAQLVARTPASRDQSHIPVIIWADPRTPDRSEAIVNGGDDPTPRLRHAATTLLDAGATELVVPCISSHHYMRDIADEFGVRLIDMIDETARHIAAAGDTTVGLLATTGTVQASLFRVALEARGIRAITPESADQDTVMSSIRLVKKGDISSARDGLVAVSAALTRAGATAIIAGCTEIPLALAETDIGATIYDPVSIVIDRIIADYFG